MEIVFSELPPSENKIRIIRVIRGRPGGMAYTKEATQYKKKFKTEMLKTYATDIVAFASQHTPESTYKVTIELFFNREQLVNKGWPKTKTYYNNILMNFSLLCVFILVLALYLAYKYNLKKKKSKKDKKKSQLDIENYILSKLGNVFHQEQMRNLPKFESDYELLHEKFYNI